MQGHDVRRWMVWLLGLYSDAYARNQYWAQRVENAANPDEFVISDIVTVEGGLQSRALSQLELPGGKRAFPFLTWPSRLFGAVTGAHYHPGRVHSHVCYGGDREAPRPGALRLDHLHNWHYAARRARVIEDHAHNAALSSVPRICAYMHDRVNQPDGRPGIPAGHSHRVIMRALAEPPFDVVSVVLKITGEACRSGCSGRVAVPRVWWMRRSGRGGSSE